jgi:hypothetical protein
MANNLYIHSLSEFYIPKKNEDGDSLTDIYEALQTVMRSDYIVIRMLVYPFQLEYLDKRFHRRIVVSVGILAHTPGTRVF